MPYIRIGLDAMQHYPHKRRTLYRILNQAEDFSPLGSSPLPGSPQKPRIKFSGGKKGRTMNPLIQLKQTTAVFLLAFGLMCFGLSPIAQAADETTSNANTGEGNGA